MLDVVRRPTELRQPNLAHNFVRQVGVAIIMLLSHEIFEYIMPDIVSELIELQPTGKTKFRSNADQIQTKFRSN